LSEPKPLVNKKNLNLKKAPLIVSFFLNFSFLGNLSEFFTFINYTCMKVIINVLLSTSCLPDYVYRVCPSITHVDRETTPHTDTLRGKV
ncbi:MAG: hypothetical protein PUP93_06345, partial [Rhizonema sp. NSF051]|nr:hypothetical protein [Rhizonema sp. NSF051]